MSDHVLRAGFAAALLGLSWLGPAQAAPLLIVGNDEKVTWDQDGKLVLSPPGHDTVVIFDLADPENPKALATLPLENSVVGPPTNIAIAPSGQIALFANSVDVIKDGEALKQVPNSQLYVFDLT